MEIYSINIQLRLILEKYFFMKDMYKSNIIMHLHIMVMSVNL